MGINIERLLRLAADYHNFCSDDYKMESMSESDELTMDDLDLISAAGGLRNEEMYEDDTGKTIY